MDFEEGEIMFFSLIMLIPINVNGGGGLCVRIDTNTDVFEISTFHVSLK